MTPLGRAAALALVALCACRDVELPAPSLTSVDPPLAPNDAAVTLTIRGEHLLPRPVTDFQREGQSTLDTRYTATLGEVALEQVRLEEPGRLTAVLPAGVAPGLRALTLVDPRGRSAVLEDAVRVYDPTALDHFAFSPVGEVVVGVPLALQVQAVNAQGTRIATYVGSPVLDDTADQLTGRVAGPFVAGQWSGEVTFAAPVASTALRMTDGAAVGQSNAFAVLEPAPVAWRIATPPRIARAGTCSDAVTIELVDGAGTVVPARAALPLTAAVTGLPVQLFADPGCGTAANLQIPAGERRLSLHFRGTAPGTGALELGSTLGTASQAVQVVPGAPATLRFVTAAPRVTVATCTASALQLELADTYGNPIAESADTVVSLATAANGPGFFSAAGCGGTAVTSVVVPAGQGTASFHLRGDAVGVFPVQAAAGALSAAQDATVVAGPPASVHFTNPARSATAGACSEALVLELRDGFGNTTVEHAGVTLSLAAVGASGPVQFHAGSCPADPDAPGLAQVQVAAGASSVTLVARSRSAGTYDLTATSGTLASAAQPFTVVAGTPTQLVFTSPHPGDTEVDVCSVVQTVELRDVYGNPAPAPAGGRTASVHAGGEPLWFFRSATCAEADQVTTLTFAAGSSTASFHFTTPAPGVYLIRVDAGAGLLVTRQVDLVAGPPAQIAFVSPVQTISAGACSAPVTLELRDDTSNQTHYTAPHDFNLVTVPLGMSYHADPACQDAPITKITFAAGEMHHSFFARATVLNEPDGYYIVVHEPAGLFSNSQELHLAPGPLDHLTFTSAVQGPVDANACSAAETVQLRDAFENPVLAPAGGTSASLAAAPNGLTFYGAAGCGGSPLTALTFPAGASTASFRWQGAVAGTTTITAAVGASQGTRQVTVANPMPAVRGPYLQAATVVREAWPGPTPPAAAADGRIRVYFSRPMDTASATNRANYCVELYDGAAGGCSQTSDFTIASVHALDARTYDLYVNPGSTIQASRYTVWASNLTDTGGLPLSTPRSAEVQRQPAELRLELARSLSATTIELAFNQPLGIGGPGAAECSGPSVCNAKYELNGPTLLGDVTSAVVQPAPNDHKVVLTHSLAQQGRLYTVLCANGTSGDGFDDTGALQSPNGALMARKPLDRAPFLGSGAAPAALSTVWAYDPFGDGTRFGKLFAHRGRLQLGADKDGVSMLRTEPDGSWAERQFFRLYKDLDGNGGATSANTSSSDFFRSIGALNCTANTAACGPDNENGRGTVASAAFAGAQWMVFGGARPSNTARYVYLSLDEDRELDLHYVDLSGVAGPSTRAFTSVGGMNGRLYLGGYDTGGNKPYLDVLTSASGLVWGRGLDPSYNTALTACGSAGACDLDATHMPGVGNQKSIDAFTTYRDRLYWGNSGGLVRSTTATPDNYAVAPAHWTTNPSSPVAITPNASAYTNCLSLVPPQNSDLLPGMLTWTPLVEHRGKLYAGRNVVIDAAKGCGPQLWRCDPAGGPDPEHCDAGDWSLIVAGGLGVNASQFGNANNRALTLLAVSGGHLYVGFDNMSEGISLWRSSVADPLALSDFQGTSELGGGACTAGTANCRPLGLGGFGLPGENRQIHAHATLQLAGSDYLYVATGDLDQTSIPVRVYRQVEPSPPPNP